MTHIIHKVRRYYSALHWLVIVIFLALGFLALNYNHTWDITHNRSHSLSTYSRDVVAQLDAPVTILAFVDNNATLRQGITRVLRPYLQASDQLTLRFKHPNTALGLVRKYGVQQVGTLIFTQGKRFTPVTTLTESAVTKGLQTVQRIRPLTIAFAYGHGERYPESEANFHFRDFANALTEAGLATVSVDLATHDQIPDNADVLVLADPRMTYRDAAKTAIQRYLKNGKNALILAERQSVKHLRDTLPWLPLADGVVSNASGQAFGINDSHISVIKPSAQEAKYPPLANLPSVLLFPQVTALTSPKKDWAPILTHAPKSLVMIDGKVEQRDDARVALEATRLHKAARRTTRQRVVLVADADFLSNQFLGNGANREFGVRLLTFLARPAYELTLQPPAPDRHVTLTDAQHDTLTRILVIYIPLMLLIIGLVVGRIYTTRYRD